MNKEQSADDPSVDLIRVKNMRLIKPFQVMPLYKIRTYRT